MMLCSQAGLCTLESPPQPPSFDPILLGFPVSHSSPIHLYTSAPTMNSDPSLLT